jgi:hypothetical protein
VQLLGAGLYLTVALLMWFARRCLGTAGEL